MNVLGDLEILPLQVPEPPSIGESEDLDVLGDSEILPLQAPEPSPPLGKVKIWMFWEIRNFAIASTRTTPLHWGKSRFGCVGRFRKFYHCKYQNSPSIGESKDLDVFRDLEILPLQAPEPLPLHRGK